MTLTPLKGKVVITGGSGSLGTAILERAERENWGCSFTALARNETKMAQVRSRFPSVHCVLGDIRDHEWLETVFRGHDLVVHAAALKIVPVAESSPKETIMTNIIGSLNVAQAAIKADVPRVVGISSDKACGPTYYGTTKRLMEGLFREAGLWEMTKTQFVLCRYGNVLRSANSIVPLFERQIQENKPFTVTDVDMTRFWLSMQQAIDLVLYTANEAPPGTIVVPKAPAMKVVDLAHALDPDREVVEIGIRPGERIHETLIVREEAQHTKMLLDRFLVYPPQTYRPDSGDNLSNQFEYTSEFPDHWLTAPELHELLRNS